MRGLKGIRSARNRSPIRASELHLAGRDRARSSTARTAPRRGREFRHRPSHQPAAQRGRGREIRSRRAVQPPRLSSDADSPRTYGGRRRHPHAHAVRDRKSVVSGKRVFVRVDLGGRCILKKKKKKVKDKWNATLQTEMRQ